MRLYWLLKFGAMILIASGGIGVSGCDDPTVYEPEGPTLPFSNQRIISESVLGTATQGSSIYALYEGDGGAVYFTGRIDGSYGAGRITHQGDMLWWKPMDPRPRSLRMVPANNIGLTEGVVSVTGKDTDGDDSVDKALVRLTGASGAAIDELLIERTDAEVWLNSVSAVSALEFVAVGGADIADVRHPFIATFEIGPDSMLAMNSNVILDDIPGQSCMSVVVDPARVTGSNFVCYIVARQVENSLGVRAVDIHALSGSVLDLTTHTLEWTVDIDRDAPRDLWTYIDCLELHNGNIYFAGCTNIDKENNPASGSYWDAGFVGSVSVNGNLNWKRIISISEHSENYYDIYVTDEALFALGSYGGYVKTSSNRWHGLAFLSIFDPNTGVEKYHLGLGSDDYSSGINSALVAGSIALCAGWTNLEEIDSGFQAWVAQVDIDGLPNTNFMEIPAMPLADGPVEESNAPHPMEVGR